MLMNLLNSSGCAGALGVGGGASQVHRGRYYIAVRRGGEDVKRDISIGIERLFQADTLKIVLWDEEEPAFLCAVRVTRSDYEELKKQQGLLVDFDNFPAQLVRLLQQCAASNMFLILQQNDPRQYFLEVVEHNEFRRLVHLSLKTAPASEAEVRAHMADTIASLKKSLTAAKNASSSSEVAWKDKCSAMERKIQEITVSLSRMEEERQRREAEHQEMLKIERERFSQERLEWQKVAEETTRHHSTSAQETLARKDKQLDELTTRCRQHRDSITSLEAQLSDKSQRVGLLEKEVQKAHIEVATLRAKNSTLERESIEKDRQIHQLHIKTEDVEKTLRETNDRVKELTSTVQTLQRDKINLEQKLSLSESLLNKNNAAVQSSSEQLLKANQIISKQNADLIELKEKLLCRTAIVLEQEKVIEQNSQLVQESKKREEEARTECSRLREERDSLSERLAAQEKELKEKDETIKNNNMVIQWLHKKREEEPVEKRREHSSRRAESTARSSAVTEYLLNNSSEDDCEEIPTAKTTEASLKSDRSKSGKSGLDPRYLRPADEDKVTKTNEKANPTNATTKGKENKSANLPRVNYQSKKSGRSVTYRTTPVSAYFP